LNSVANIILFSGITAASSAVAVELVRRLALRRRLFDVPNVRSSHTTPVPRLGGIAFIPVILLAAVIAAEATGGLGNEPFWFCALVLIIALVGLIDDLYSLPATARLLAQLMTGSGLFYRFYFLHPDKLAMGPLPLGGAFLISVLWIASLINAYNFMDGIDGIAALQAVIAGAGWGAIGLSIGSAWTAILGWSVAMGALGFLALNWSPARIFMGDVGSTALGFIFAGLPLVGAGSVGPRYGLGRFLAVGAMLVWPFIFDTAATLMCRIWRRENVFKAHRSHLYQRLVISGKSHRFVSLLYGLMAASGVGLAWTILRGPVIDELATFTVPVLAFGATWLWTAHRERARRD